jgi:hypothetical protein
MKKIEEIVNNLSQYSHIEQHSIHGLLDYIEGTANPQQQKETEALLKVNKSLAQIVKGLQIYFTLYGSNHGQLINYLQKARTEGYVRIKNHKSQF